MLKETLRSKLISLIFLCALISACSGGGSTKDLNKFSITYSGNADLVQLNRINSLNMLETLYDMALPAYYLSSIGTSASTPYFLEIDPSSMNEDICENEGIRIDDRRSKTETEGTIVFHFSDCESEGALLNGKLIYKIYDVDENSLKIKVSIEELVLASLVDTVTFDGNTIYSEIVDGGFTLTGQLQARSEKRELDFQITNLHITDSSLSADIFHGNEGFVSVTIDGKSDQIIMRGALDTMLTGNANKVPSNYPIPSYIESYDLELTDGVERDFPLVTTINISTLLDRADKPNSQITRSETDNYTIDRLDTLMISSSIIDPDGDFVEYTWGNKTRPEGCVSSIERQATTSAHFTSNCQGSHSVSLFANDGFNPEVEYALTISVIPLPAELQVVEDIAMTKGSQLNVPVVINNLEEDGPFTFSLDFAPKGLSIDDQGLITGEPIAFVKEENTSYKIGVKVDNGRSSTLDFVLAVDGGSSDKSLISNMDICKSYNRDWMDIDGDGLPEMACPFLHSYRLFEKTGNEITISYVELEPPSEEALDSVIHYDLDSDGIAEVFLGYESEIIVIDGSTKNIKMRVPIPFTPNQYFREYEILPPPENFNGFFIYANNDTNEFHLLNAKGEVIVEPMMNGPAINFMSGYKNIDDDPEPEIFSESWLYNFGESGHSILSESINKVEDIDGDGEKDLLRLTKSGPIGPQTWTIDHFDDQLNLIAQYVLSKPDFIESTYWTDEIELINIDEDPEKEIIESNGLLVFNLQGDNFEFMSQLPYDYKNNNLARTFFTQLDSNSILLPGEYSAYTFTGPNNFTELSYTHPIYQSKLSKPSINSDGSASFYFSDIGEKTRIGIVDIARDGRLLNTEILSDIDAPYYAHSIIGTSYSSPDAKEVLIEGLNSNFQIFDVATQTITYQSSFENTASKNSELLAGDFDQDGQPDYFSVSRQGNQSDPMITWFDPYQDVERWSFVDNANEYYSSPEISRIISFDGGAQQSLVSLFSPHLSSIDYELKVFSFDSEDVIQTFSLGINERYDWVSTTMGFQDIDNDGKLEIIISKFERGCGNDRGSEIELIDDDLTYLHTIQVNECISVIPDIISSTPKANIIASSPVGEPRLIRSSGIAAYSKFVEIGASTGDVIWESKWFIGQLASDSLVTFGDDPYLNKKIGVFDTGIYAFD